MRVCSRCGAPIGDEDQICKNCGMTFGAFSQNGNGEDNAQNPGNGNPGYQEYWNQYGNPQPNPYPPYYAPKPAANGLCVASLVFGILSFIIGFLYFIPCILAIVFGCVGRSQVKKSGGRQSGEGIALAGIICGIVALVIWIAFTIIGIMIISNYGYSGLYNLLMLYAA